MTSAGTTQAIDRIGIGYMAASASTSPASLEDRVSEFQRAILQWFPVTIPNQEKDASTIEALTMSNTEALTFPLSDREAESRFESLFRSSGELNFEDGIETEFSKRLTALVRSYGPLSKDILAGLFEDKTVSPEAQSEALRWLGRMEDQQSRETRLWLLERSLNSPAPIVRDGAILGLASMDDPRAIRYLRIAIEKEKLPELRSDMLEVLDQLSTQP
jgi:hypothetical protein